MSPIRSIPFRRIGRRPAKISVPIRIVPEPKTFRLRVTWGETVEQPITVTRRVHPHPGLPLLPPLETVAAHTNVRAVEPSI